MVYPVVEHLGTDNVIELLRGVDLVVDGLDNFPTRYLLNDACVREGVPWIYGGAVATGGMSMPILPPSNAGSSIARPSELVGPCLRCIFPEAPPPGSSPTCDTAGVLAPAIATVAGHQVTQAMKLIVGAFDAIDRSLVSWDLWSNTRSAMDLSRAARVDCPCCGGGIRLSGLGIRGAGHDPVRPELGAGRSRAGSSPGATRSVRPFGAAAARRIRGGRLDPAG